jgi:hypothetical protein
MAKARTIHLLPPEPPPEPGIQLELSRDEAEALLTVLSHVGGPEYEGQPRFHVTAIYEALTGLGMKLNIYKYSASGSVYFPARKEINGIQDRP